MVENVRCSISRKQHTKYDNQVGETIADTGNHGRSDEPLRIDLRKVLAPWPRWDSNRSGLWALETSDGARKSHEDSIPIHQPTMTMDKRPTSGSQNAKPDNDVETTQQ